MKAILIARVSTEEQREVGNSLPAQMVRLEHYCKNKGFEIAHRFSFDESAYTNQRDEFDQITQFIIDLNEKVAICCDKVDRLSRNIFDKRVSQLYNKALCDELELHFVSEGQVITSRISAVEKFQFGMSLGLAKYYSDAISDNVKRAIEQKLRKGEWPAKAPYGYKNIKIAGDKKDIVIEEYQAHIVGTMFQLYATGAYSLALLGQKLKKDYGINWGTSYIDMILNNHFYYGFMVSKGVKYPHRYPTLISKELFDKVQQIKTSYNKKRSKYAGQPYIYRGLLRCARCNLAITPEKHKGFVYYHCTQYNGKHDAKWFREERITQEFEQIFKRIQIPQEALEEIKNTLTGLHQTTAEFNSKRLDELTREQKTLSKMMDNLYLDKKLKGRITDSEYDRFYQSFRDQRMDVDHRLEALQRADANYYITAQYLLKLISRAYDLFISSEVEEKRQLIKLILSNVRVDDESIVYNAQKPFDLILTYSDYPLWCARQDSNLRPTD